MGPVQAPAGHIAFNCYRTSSLSGSNIVNYQGCDVDTTEGAMDKDTGKFKAKKSGLYRIHFHAYINTGKSAYLDIMKGSTRIARMGEGQRSDTYGTVSNSVIVRMEENEEVYVDLFNSSYEIYSNGNKWIVFEGFFLAPL